jgi:hypothetical protein
MELALRIFSLALLRASFPSLADMYPPSSDDDGVE